MPSAVTNVTVVDQGLISAYGDGVACCADGLLSGRTALAKAGDAFPAQLSEMPVGRVPHLGEGSGRLMRLLERLFETGYSIPSDAVIYAATTVGEIDVLEAAVRAGKEADAASSCVSTLGTRVAALLKRSPETGLTFSAACASSTAALAMAASAIRRGELSCALVVGCDSLSEFVLSGFSALMALDARGARPFDLDRKGVSLGEAAAYVVLMSEERAVQEGRAVQGYLHGWGVTCDANHLTGPSRDGLPLSDAIEQALNLSGLNADDVDAICAHGTGTLYNDQMELLAFHRAIKQRPVPLFSVKGGMGHTLGAAGLAEMLLSLEFLKRGIIPSTIGMGESSPEAVGWASTEAQAIQQDGVMLTTNSGFGGVNVALLVSYSAMSRRDSLLLTQGQKDVRTQEQGPASHDAMSHSTFVPPKHFARFSADAQRASRALAERLSEEGLFMDEERLLRWNVTGAPVARVGLSVWNRKGSLKVNFAYFADYVASGSVLGRGQLFAATLPTSVASEVAIACRLTGPLIYVADTAGTDVAARQVARQCIADGLADAMILLDVGETEIEIVFMKEGAL
jgi:3-oxoacyl-[acyl-carrier-protein] synthase II